jgi:hypothetical protein
MSAASLLGITAAAMALSVGAGSVKGRAHATGEEYRFRPQCLRRWFGLGQGNHYPASKRLQRHAVQNPLTHLPMTSQRPTARWPCRPVQSFSSAILGAAPSSPKQG